MKNHLTQYRVTVDERTEQLRVEKRPHPGITLTVVASVGIMALACMTLLVRRVFPMDVASALFIAASLTIFVPVTWLTRPMRGPVLPWQPVRDVDQERAAAAVVAVMPASGDRHPWRYVSAHKVAELEAAIATGRQRADDGQSELVRRRDARADAVLRTTARKW